MKRLAAAISFLVLFTQFNYAQFNQEASNSEKYTIQKINFTGAKNLSPRALQSFTGLEEGDQITLPSKKISNAIKKIWKQDLVGDIKVSVEHLKGNNINLTFHLSERPRLSGYKFIGLKNSEIEDISKNLNLVKGKVVTNVLLKNIKNSIKNHFINEGYYNTEVDIRKEKDTLVKNSVRLYINVKKKEKVKVKEITIHGNKAFDDKKLEKKMENTNEKRLLRIFSSSKFIPSKYKKDKTKLTDFYKSKGYRNARIISDSVYQVEDDRVNIEITLTEGDKYYFRNITWEGNYVYDDKTLSRILGIKKGDVYNYSALQKRLKFNPNGMDVSSLYLDNGYLFFNVTPVETNIEGDSIDLEMRIYEGKQATIDEVNIAGNTKTHDHVIRREIRTYPGRKFSRQDIIRSQREIAQLGFFDPKKTQITPKPDPEEGTVDINYNVKEKPSDQIELSGGWGGAAGFVGTLGLTFNNFSLRNIPNLNQWKPLPTGDGQRLSLRFQANGRRYQTFNFSFNEPWLGGSKPNSFTVSLRRSIQRNFNRQREQIGALNVSGATVSLGRRLKWPDDYFSMTHSLEYMNYKLDNFNSATLGISDGNSNSITLTNSIARNSIGPNPRYPTKGSKVKLSLTATPPYSIVKERAPDNIKWVEYHKWMMDNSWFIPLDKNDKLVLNTRFHFGLIGSYTNKGNIGPFERFYLGGDGLSGQNFLLGRDIIGLRGYQNNSIVPSQSGGIVYDKFVMELRYPITTGRSATIYALSFFEGGNNWGDYKNVNPFSFNRSVGVGARIFMPAFGLIGIDYGIGLDEIPGKPAANENRFTFTIGQTIR